MVKLFAYFAYFSRNNLISYDLKSLKAMFNSGMNLSSLHSSYCDNVEEEIEKIAVKEISEDMEDILKQFNVLNEQLLEKLYKEKAEKLFKCIPMNMTEFYAMFDKECMNIPIFKYFDPYQVFQRISCASNEDTVIIKERLVKRAEKYKDEIEPEIKNIRMLKQIMDDYIKGKEITIKIVILKDFSRELGNIIDKYKTSLF